mmetsp:Transcript_36790/g.92184  ORF Transcript_36790/g.92184 Transcript_36790/m.92184 type:complete len:183 (-) Transcript_36790:573-1121(-)
MSMSSSAPAVLSLDETTDQLLNAERELNQERWQAVIERRLAAVERLQADSRDEKHVATIQLLQDSNTVMQTKMGLLQAQLVESNKALADALQKEAAIEAKLTKTLEAVERMEPLWVLVAFAWVLVRWPMLLARRQVRQRTPCKSLSKEWTDIWTWSERSCCPSLTMFGALVPIVVAVRWLNA